MVSGEAQTGGVASVGVGVALLLFAIILLGGGVT
jgi:hypothetical protein